MPFEETKEGVKWRAPTDEEIVSNRNEILEVKATENFNLSDDMKKKVENAIANAVPGQGWGIIAASNSKLYDTIKNVVATAPGLVDIIIPVHNSIHIVRKCIQAALDRTSWPYHITIVDDASDEATNHELYRLAETNKPNITLLTNKKNRGFAATVNKGIKETNGEYVCLLNSDVLVTDMWLTKMVMAHKADPRNMIICPATNNTAIVNVPMAQGGSYINMNRVFEHYAMRTYPEIMPTGFCFLFPRKLIDKIGLFDEGFKNFGEESDFWMKTRTYVEGDTYPRWRAVMAEDTYVFHERGSSYSALGQEAEVSFRKLASSRFHNRWPEYAEWERGYNKDRELGHLKQQIPSMFFNQGKPKYRICWVTHSVDMCGGMKFIADLINEINERGGDARVAVIKRSPEDQVTVLPELRCGPIIFNDYEDFVNNFPHKGFKNGFVVASTAELAPSVKELTDANNRLTPILHVQSFEPSMITEDVDERIREGIDLSFKIIPDVISSSGWVTKELKKLGVKPFATVLPGVDTYLFYPRGRDKGDERKTVMLSMTQQYKFKGFDRGVKLIHNIEELARQEDLDIRILVYGTEELPIVSNAICLGRLTQTRLANLLGSEVDVFVDPSHIHSYGMPSLEALASGVDVVSWDNRGIREFFKSKKNVFPNDASPVDVAKRVIEILKREKYVRPVKEVPDRGYATGEFIRAIEGQFKSLSKPRRIVVVSPHMRKHGGPTTIINIANELADRGHDVTLTSVYSDVNPEVTKMTDLPISLDAHKIPTCEVLITNSDNPMNETFAQLDHAKHKIMLKLSHNPRFQELENKGLEQDWDAVVTSTDWLADVCQKPEEGWSYKPREATRIGWWHYSHDIMACHPESREYGDGKNSAIHIATLIHAHPSKGTVETIAALGAIYKKYGAKVIFTGVGEVPPSKFNAALPNFRYVHAPNRHQLAELLRTVDIWVGASHTEGLGRMALEAMSASAACVLSDTRPEFARDRHNCLLFPVRDSQKMADNINELIENPELAQKIREQGHQTAISAANAGPCIYKLDEVINKVCDG
jgi:GT2 family glycosyltransferase/glycosyltransferase involved in cell wall biosynthesis